MWLTSLHLFFVCRCVDCARVMVIKESKEQKAAKKAYVAAFIGQNSQTLTACKVNAESELSSLLRDFVSRRRVVVARPCSPFSRLAPYHAHRRFADTVFFCCRAAHPHTCNRSDGDLDCRARAVAGTGRRLQADGHAAPCGGPYSESQREDVCSVERGAREVAQCEPAWSW